MNAIRGLALSSSSMRPSMGFETMHGAPSRTGARHERAWMVSRSIDGFRLDEENHKPPMCGHKRGAAYVQTVPRWPTFPMMATSTFGESGRLRGAISLNYGVTIGADH
jgi:hypothetical protein